MPRTIRFHLDENCHRAVAEGLRRRGFDVTTTPDVALLTATDAEHAAFCKSQGRVLFTQDRDFLRMHAADQQHPGVVYCEKDTRSIGAIIQGLVLIWEIMEPSEMAGRVEYL